MKLLSLKAVNYRLLGEVHIRFPVGVTVITGENEAGKSTILEAVLYSLYGSSILKKKYGQGAKIGDAINHFATVSTLTLEFEVNGEKYRVIRQISRRGASRAALWRIEPGNRLIASTVSEVNREILRLIGGVTLDEILTSNVVAQKDLDRIVEMGRSDREKVINAFLNLESFNKATDILKEGRRETYSKLEIERERLNSLQVKKKEKDRIEREIRETTARLKEAEDRLTKVTPELNRVTMIFEALDEYWKALGHLKELKQKRESLRRQEQQETRRLKRALENLDRLNSLSRRAGELSGSIEAKRNVLEKASMEVRNLQARLSTADRTYKLGIIISAILATVSLIVSAIYGLKALFLMISALPPLYQAYKKRVEMLSIVDKLSIEEEKTGRIKEEIKKMEEELNQAKGAIRALESSTREVEEAEMEIRKIKDEISRVESEIESIKLPELPLGIEFSEETYVRYRDRKSKLENEKGRLETLIEEYERKIEEDTERLKELKDVDEELNSQKLLVEELEKKYRAYNKTIEVISGVSRKIRAMFRPNLESYMARIVSRITSGRYKNVRLTEDYDLEVLDNRAGRYLRRNIFSGGTVDQLLLSMRLAFSLSLLPARKGIRPRFLFLDEPFASSDRYRRRNIAKLISKYLTKYYDQIIIITHISGFLPGGYTHIQLESGRVASVRNVQGIG